jgi:hypothetical protein
LRENLRIRSRECAAAAIIRGACRARTETNEQPYQEKTNH